MTADELRGWVVRRTLTSILLLAVLLYALVGYLLITGGTDAVPDALWLAAGAAAQAIYSFLSNSKGDRTESEPVPVTTAPGDAVVVEAADSDRSWSEPPS